MKRKYMLEDAIRQGHIQPEQVSIYQTFVLTPRLDGNTSTPDTHEATSRTIFKLMARGPRRGFHVPGASGHDYVIPWHFLDPQNDNPIYQIPNLT